MICGIIKVEVSVFSRAEDEETRLITLTETLIIPHITNTEFNNCFIIYISRKNKNCFTVLLATFYICFLFQRIPHAILFCIVGSNNYSR